MSSLPLIYMMITFQRQMTHAKKIIIATREKRLTIQKRNSCYMTGLPLTKNNQSQTTTDKGFYNAKRKKGILTITDKGGYLTFTTKVNSIKQLATKASA